MGLTDRIFTRIATHETIAVPQSAFLMDLSQVSAMLRHATPRCWDHTMRCTCIQAYPSCASYCHVKPRY